jgi:predicted Fe-Mo cluster-binding NifX family protein
MNIAIPVAQGRLCPHFGHCETFAIFEVDRDARKIIGRTDLEAPPHQPGLLPGWLMDRGANAIIAGGMGMRAQEFFKQMGIEVLVGAPSGEPETVVQSWLDDTLVLGGNICDH